MEGGGPFILLSLSLSLFDSFVPFSEGEEDFIKITVDVIVVDASPLQINKINVFLFPLYGGRLIREIS